jgi:LmbE family N-acetylglucosaminyl deacetylase
MAHVAARFVPYMRGSEFDHRTVNAAIRATLRRYRRPSLRISGNLPDMWRLTGQGAAGLRAPYAINGFANMDDVIDIECDMLAAHVRR